MSQQSAVQEDKLGLGAALGRIPSGLFILTARLDDQSTGMLASWVQQVGFEPPLVSIAVRKGRFVTGWLEKQPYFCLNQLGQGQKEFLKHFGAGFPPEADAFSGVKTHQTQGHRSIVLDDALSYMECQLAHVFATGGDHDLIIARVVDGRVQHADLEPTVHLRKSGLHY